MSAEQSQSGTSAAEAVEPSASPTNKPSPDKPDPRLASNLQEADRADPNLWSVLEKAEKARDQG